MSVVKELHLMATEAADPDAHRGSIFFIGTATVIIRFGAFTILTDPNFLHAGDHAHLGYGLTAERLTNPAIDIEQLPPLDFCVLSHYHNDHFDRVAEQKLQKDLPMVTTAHAAAELKDKGFSETVALNTWESAAITKGSAHVRVTAMPGKYGPAVVEAFLPDVMGSRLEFDTGVGDTALRLYITGDTLMYDDLKEIPQRYPDIHLALFHLGGTPIMGILLTMDAEQGLEAFQLIHPRELIPIHYLGHGETYEFEIPGAA